MGRASSIIDAMVRALWKSSSSILETYTARKDISGSFFESVSKVQLPAVKLHQERPLPSGGAEKQRRIKVVHHVVVTKGNLVAV